MWTKNSTAYAEGEKQILAKSVNKKKPITTDIFIKLKEEYQKNPDSALKLFFWCVCYDFLDFCGSTNYQTIVCVGSNGKKDA